MIETTCNNCGKKILKKPCYMKENTTHFCDKKCMYEWRRHNLKFLSQTREIMKANWQKEEFLKKMSEERHGSNNPNWRGGRWKKKNAFIDKIRRLQKYADWKNTILERDVNTYPKLPKGVQVHHIKSIERIVAENNIQTIEEAKNCKELWDTNNGLTVLAGEHLIITWLNRKKKPSRALVLYMKFFLKEMEGKIYDWCR